MGTKCEGKRIFKKNKDVTNFFHALICLDDKEKFSGL
jgi:hypothetical protein